MFGWLVSTSGSENIAVAYICMSVRAMGTLHPPGGGPSGFRSALVGAGRGLAVR